MTRLRLAWLALALPVLGAAQASDSGWLERLHLSIAGTAAWTNNLSRTSYEPTRQDAATYELSVSGNHPRQLAPNLLLLAGGEITSLAVPDFELASYTRIGGRLTLQSKFGLGPQATVLSAGVGAAYKASRLSADRGTDSDFSLQISKRIFTNLRVAAGAQWLEHDARHATFDVNQRVFSAEAQWDIDDHWTLSGNASRLSGDIVANAAWPIWAQALGGAFGPAVFNYYTSRPWEQTGQYGWGWVSYNVEADVDLWSVAVAYAFSDRTGVELRHAGAYVVNKIGIAYPTDSWSLSLTHRF